MSTAIKTFATKSQNEIRDDFLRTVKNGLVARGVASPAISPGSDFYVEGTALGNEIAVLYANQIVTGDNLMPDTAIGSALDRIANVIGLTRRVAGGSTGFVTYSASQQGLVIVGTQLVDSTGLRYQVTVGNSYKNNDPIPVAAIDTGKATNHPSADVLRWVTAPAYAAPTVVIGTAGLTGASDVEDDETLRTRVLSVFQNWPSSGNWQQVATLAEASSTLVQKGYVYPAANGPSTCHIAVVGYATNTAVAATKNRDIDATTMSGTVVPYVSGNLPEYAEITTTTVANVVTDVAIGLALPAAPTASPPGPGGGWVNGTPWPTITGSGYANVTAVTSSTRITVASPGTPVANVSKIAFLDPTNWTIYTATVTAVNNGASPWDISIDTSWPNVAIGNYVWPQAVNQIQYVANLLGAFALMGPGEKVASASGNYARAYRHPLPTLSWPYSLGPVMLRTVTSGNATLPTNAEVLDAQFLYRSTTTPAVPGAITSPPNILVPRNVGFYAL